MASVEKMHANDNISDAADVVNYVDGEPVCLANIARGNHPTPFRTRK